MLSWRSLRGFTLVEISITLAIASILLFLAMPAFSGWVANAKVRTATETLQNAIRAAQTEAVRRGRQTAFVRTNADPAPGATAHAGGRNWYIQALPLFPGEVVDTPFVQGGSFGGVASGVTIDSGTVAVVCFNSIGRLVANTASVTGLSEDCPVPGAASAYMWTYDATAPGANRTLEIQVGLAGNIRMCDKSRTLSTTHPDGC